MAKITFGYLRLRTKVAMCVTLVALLTSAIITVALYINARNQLRQDIRERLSDLVGISVLQIDAYSHATLTNRDQENSLAYNDIRSVLQKIRDRGTDIQHVYTMRQNQQGQIIFVVDAESNPAQISHIGDVYTDASRFLKANFTTLDKPSVEPNFYTDQWGTWLTGYAPFYEPDGTREGILGMDIAASRVITRERQFLWIAIVAYLAAVPLIISLGWLLGAWLTAPLDKLINSIERIIKGDLNHRLYLDTHDEISKLATSFNTMTGHLQETIMQLEQRLAVETRELDQRTQYLTATAEIGSSATTIRTIDQFFEQVIELIKRQFNLYYVGLFLVDDTGTWAILKAGTGNAGRVLLSRGHRIQIGTGMVGWSISQAQTRVALDISTDPIRQAIVELPETRSEAALPLRSRGHVIGAISVQSSQTAAFDDMTIRILQLMADQVAIAIDNARLAGENQTILETTRKAFAESNIAAWEKLLQTGSVLGFKSEENGILPLIGQPDEPDIHEEKRNRLKLPIVIRGQELGSIDAYKPENEGEWTQEEITMLKGLTDQLSVAIDNARLYSDSQSRAERERVITDITAKVRASTNLDIILQTSVQELSQALHLPKGNIMLKIGDGGASNE